MALENISPAIEASRGCVASVSENRDDGAHGDGIHCVGRVHAVQKGAEEGVVLHEAPRDSIHGGGVAGHAYLLQVGGNGLVPMRVQKLQLSTQRSPVAFRLFKLL